MAKKIKRKSKTQYQINKEREIQAKKLKAEKERRAKISQARKGKTFPKKQDKVIPRVAGQTASQTPSGDVYVVSSGRTPYGPRKPKTRGTGMGGTGVSARTGITGIPQWASPSPGHFTGLVDPRGTSDPETRRRLERMENEEKE